MEVIDCLIMTVSPYQFVIICGRNQGKTQNVFTWCVLCFFLKFVLLDQNIV